MKSAGNRKNEKKYWSIMLVPHSTNDIKVFKISSMRYKLLAFGTIITTAILCTSLTISHLVNENQDLQHQVAIAKTLNGQQAQLLEENENEIKTLIQQRNNQTKVTEEFKALYRELTNRYIEDNMNTVVATRSSSHDDRLFVEEVSKLKSILEDLEEINYSEPEISTNLEETQNKLDEYMDIIPTLWPTSGGVSSGYGYRLDPFTYRRRFHYGIDISAPTGREIKTSAKGKVILSEWYGDYGKTVIVDHGRGVTTLYAHCSDLLVNVGQTVDKGEVIAKVGNTGRSTGSHLHFEVRVNGSQVDPLEYLDPR
ncbi:UNVERIFIED_CONTAM: Membrane proteins related to metalloendopeptidases [Acetivibrio alkalicellulosi]